MQCSRNNFKPFSYFLLSFFFLPFFFLFFLSSLLLPSSPSFGERGGGAIAPFSPPPLESANGLLSLCYIIFFFTFYYTKNLFYDYRADRTQFLLGGSFAAEVAPIFFFYFFIFFFPSLFIPK